MLKIHLNFFLLLLTKYYYFYIHLPLRTYIFNERKY